MSNEPETDEILEELNKRADIEGLVRDAEEVKRNAIMFDEFVEMVPEDAYVSLIDSVLERGEREISPFESIFGGWAVFKMIAYKAGYLEAVSTFLKLLLRSTKKRKEDEAETLIEDSRFLREVLISCWLTLVGFEDPENKPLPENFFATLADSCQAIMCGMTEEDAKKAFDIFKTYLEKKDA